MVRPKDPNGRDRTRTIQLSGNVAEIAERLADEGKLSREISRLLFQEYGYSNKRKKIEAEIALIEEQMQNLAHSKAQAENALELALNHQKVNSKVREEIAIKLEAMIEALRVTEAMIQCGMTTDKHGYPLEKRKRDQSELVEKFRNQLEAFE